jgi:PBP1b-binding outer membrane lipoprotein LpoB
MTKKIALSLVLAASFSLAACSKEETPANNVMNAAENTMNAAGNAMGNMTNTASNAM